jgi:hypothetical protein
MQPERPVSIALTTIGAAFAVPDYISVSHHHATPGTGLIVGGLVGAFGVLLGSLLTTWHPARLGRALGLAFWTLIALAFSGATLFGAWHTATWAGRALFGLTSALPLAGPTLVLTRSVLTQRGEP